MKLNDRDINRYSRQISLPNIGMVGQGKLKYSKVLIIGAGGLGSPVAQYLTGSGIGKIIIADGDVVTLSNLHRQIIYREGDIGENKAHLICKRLSQLNPSIELIPVPQHLDEFNALSLINQVDLVIDCTDNLLSRYLINDACVLADKAFISASVYRNEGQLGVFNYRGSATYRCLYPEGKNRSEIPSCDELGVLGTLTGLLGVLQANEAIKVILGIGDLLINKVLYTSILNNITSIFKYDRKDEEIRRVIENGLVAKKAENKAINVEGLALLDIDEWIFIDVRDGNEKPDLSGPRLISLPLKELDENTLKMDNTESYICFCQSGVRSVIAADMMAKMGFQHVRGFTGDINDLTSNNYIELKKA